jgi:hypothetical protein
MGADFIYAYVPKCELNEERRKRLAAIIAGLAEDDNPGLENSIEEWRARLTTALEAMEGSRRDVSTLSLPGAEYEVLISGGMSWGEEPTNACTLFGDIGECADLFAELKEYARDDFRKALRAAAKESQLTT